MEKNSLIGKVVHSKAGRDMHKTFIVVGILSNEYVYISDGELRRIEKPKKKKIKHLNFTGTVAEEIRDIILSKKEVTNSKIKIFLQSADIGKEV
ncbi:KOW domain-containing RNA-binding protein [Clostridium estertheticum]|uniref:KOW domain-containing RNA-binding protein n=1 Tax=Clostridium estertheticum TaxID=238834 RepID=A0AA47EIC4_9CLOT|nr:KOW domain-containing RNA-binding protein [Clostridium estertheticum]MBU3157066.1 KOW domain-containing RNA-binding protein [Clostridium estertheticum]MBU3178237.1 KOW domain-containing RNA-binding protein [Clostridium estertheticum]MBU3198198.1 KOW domain-containing RNA-binding protein [Clostridium estertheticum]WAG59944.1 KOW domain-containing RNA-binding protein [Clostridium estertheticum]WAG65985.1 KOW domain-containing RNA-binding protein [Clostridium estertheticum]